MFSSAPRASIIIPTHNRADLLENSLAALSRQTCARDEYEVLVVADGCTDRTPQIVRDFEQRLLVRLIEQKARGPAASRNRGAAEARSDLLIFMDDDIEALPGFVEAHLNAHQDAHQTSLMSPHLGDQRQVAIGYLPPLLKIQQGYFKAELRHWWETIFQRMSEPGHRFQYMDLVSGNFSLRKDFFQHVGGFDVGYRCHEDFELGIRLLGAGARFEFVPQAAGYHHEKSDLERVLQRKYEEGVADVQIGQQYPDLRPTLLMARLHQHSLLPSRILKLLAFAWPATGDHMANHFMKWLPFFEKIRWYTMWQRLLYGLMGYWYWRGVSESLSTLRATRDFLAERCRTGRPRLLLKIDLADGIPAAEAMLDAYRPDEISVRLNRIPVGCIRHQPGAEKLRGAHLRSILVRDLQAPLLNALAKDPDFAHPDAAERLLELCSEILKNRKLQEARGRV